MAIPTHCPNCGRTTIHYHRDGNEGEETWICDTCGHTWCITVPGISKPPKKSRWF